MDQFTRVGVDTSKSVFQLHCVGASDRVVKRARLSRGQFEKFAISTPSTEFVLEACGGSHHWARWLEQLGHRVKLIAPQLSKPYVKRGKNDAADAEALCEASERPTMRFVPIKTQEQQAGLMLVGVRDRLIRNRTQLSNAMRGHATEFGVVCAKGFAHLPKVLARVMTDEALPDLAKQLFADLAEEFRGLQARIDAIDAKLAALHKSNELSCRLAEREGIGPVGATMLVFKTPDPHAFTSGRQFAAWMGMTPKDHSTAGKQRLGGITRAGDESLRAVLVAGAMAVVANAIAGRKAPAWVTEMLKRKPAKLVAVALANKNARIAWKLMVSGERYNPARTAA